MDDLKNPFASAFKKERRSNAKRPATTTTSTLSSNDVSKSNLKQTSLLNSSILSKKEMDLKGSGKTIGSAFSSSMSNIDIPIPKKQDSSIKSSSSSSSTNSTTLKSKVGSSSLSTTSSNIPSIPKKKRPTSSRDYYSDEDDAYSSYYSLKEKEKEKEKSSSSSSSSSSINKSKNSSSTRSKSSISSNFDSYEPSPIKSKTTITTRSKSDISSINKSSKKKEEDNYDDPIFSNFSLDDLLNDRKKTGKFLENIDTDKVLLDNKNITSGISRGENVNVKSVLGSEIDFNDEETKQLQDLFVPEDLFLIAHHQRCIFEEENQVPTVMELKISDTDIQKYPILKLLNSKDSMKNELSILNSLDTLIKISKIELIPEILVKYLYSQICYNKNDLIVSQSYSLLMDIVKKVNKNSNICNDIFSFEYFFNTFNSYSIKIPMDSLQNATKIKDYFSSKKCYNKSFPFVNLNKVLAMLKYSIKLEQFTISQIKELIKFLVILSLDPWFSFKIPQNQMNIHHLNKKSKKSDIEAPSKQENFNNVVKSSCIFNSIKLLKSTLSELLELFFKVSSDVVMKKEEDIVMSESDNSNSNNINSNSSYSNNISSPSMKFINISATQELFDEIFSVVKEDSKFALYTRIAEFLPSETEFKVRERFSLYCISKMLATLPKKEKKKKSSKKLKKSKNENNEMSDNDSNTDNQQKEKEDKLILEEEKEKELKQNKNNSTTITKESTDNSKEQLNDKENSTKSPQIEINTTPTISSSKASLVEEIFNTDDIISTLIKLIESYIYRIKNEKINIIVMVMLVQLVNICVDNPIEIKKHYGVIEPLFKTWNSKVKEPENIDFNRSRIKDLIVFIQSKITGLGTKKTEIVTDYFSTK